VKLSDTSTWYRSRRTGVRHSGVKTMVERKTRRIVGVHCFGPDAEESINVMAAAMSAGMTADDLVARPLTYPTSAMDFEFLF
jgi:glutathione reductase (NADPH)